MSNNLEASDASPIDTQGRESPQIDPRLSQEFANFQRDPDVADRVLNLEGPVTQELIQELRELKKTRVLCRRLGLMNAYRNGEKPDFLE